MSPPETRNLAIDGERYTFVTPFEVEVLKGHATFLSPYGAFVDEFDVEGAKAAYEQSKPKDEEMGKNSSTVVQRAKELFCCWSSQKYHQH